MRVVAAEEGDTIEGISRRYAAGVSPNLVAVVNDLYVDEPLADGQLVEVPVAEPYVPPPSSPLKNPRRARCANLARGQGAEPPLW